MKSNYFKGLLLFLLTTVTFLESSAQCILNAYATNINADCGTLTQTYDVVVEFSNKPATGNLRLRNAITNANIATTPVSSLSSNSHTLTGISFDMTLGTPFVYVEFSANTSCPKYFYVPLYSCKSYPSTSTAGTFDATVTKGKKYIGSGNDEYVLNYNGDLVLTHNNNYQVSFKESSNDGVEYIFYPCKPEVNVHPFTNKCTIVDSNNGFASYTSSDAAYPNPNMRETCLGNNSPLLTAFPNTFSQNKAWVMPTAIDELFGKFRVPANYFANAIPFSIQYLNQITATKTENCAGGSINFTSLFGGYPEFHASNYTITNNGGGSLSTTSVALNGSFSLTGLTNGTAYNITISDINGGETILSGTFCSATATADCGSCATPTCPIGFDNNISDGLGFSTCKNTATTITNETVTNIHTVRSSASGTLGFVQQVGFLDGCKNAPAADATLAARTYALYALGNCNGSAIVATTPNGGNSSTLNPEWTGLTPNTDYILKITVPVTTCGVNATCTDYYHPAASINCSTCATATCPILHTTGTSKTISRNNATTAMSSATAVSEINTNITTGTSKTICVPVTVSANSTTIGFKHAFNLLGTGFCTISDPDIQRSYLLKPANNCGGSAIAPKSANAQPVQSGFNPEWDVVTTTPGVGELNPGDYIFCITISLNNAAFDCVLLDKLLLVEYQVKPTCTTPAAPTVSSPIIYCQNATASALSAIGTSLLWYNTATGGTGSTTAPTPSTAATDSTTYYVSQTISGCESPRASITVTVNAVPAAPSVVIPIVNYCQNTTAIALSANGDNLLWYNTAIGGTGSSTAAIPSTATIGSTAYYVSQTKSGCESPREAIVVKINGYPTAPTVTTPIVYCQYATATALSASGTGLLWYNTATGGTGSPTAPIPSTAAAGSTTYYVSQTFSGCESTRTAIVVTVNSGPTAPTATSPIVYCQNATATALSATGTNLLWYSTATGGTGSITAPIPSTTVTRSTTYYVTQTISGCESPRTSITVTVNATPVAPTVVTPVTYCQDDTASVLTATGSNLLWYTAPTGGTGSASAPTPTTATAGDTTYYVSQTILGCEGPRAAITVTVNATPVAPTVITPVTYCQDDTASALNATGSNLLWYTGVTGGTGSASAPTPTTATAGDTTYYVSQSILGCEGPRAAITVTVNATPAAPTVVTPVTYCQNAIASALTASGSNLLWYTAPNGGTGSASAPTPSTATAGNTTYYVSQSLLGCKGSRASITVTINANPNAPTVVTPVNYCIGDIAIPLTASGSNLLWYETLNGAASIIAPTPSTTTIGSTTYYVSQTLGTCESPKTAIVVTISTTTISLDAGCIDADYTLTAAAPAGTTFKWYQGTTLLSNTTNTLVITSPGNYRVVGTLNGCSIDATENATFTYCEIPKGISPNGDGLNDNFDLSNLKVKHLQIFNRYGMEMYSKANYKNEWNGYSDSGLNLPDGTYYYIIHFESGKTKTGWVYKNNER